MEKYSKSNEVAPVTLMQEVLEHTRSISDRIAAARIKVSELNSRMTGFSAMDGPKCVEDKIPLAASGDLNVLNDLLRGMKIALTDLEDELRSIEDKF